MIQLTTIVGTRPQVIKASALHRQIKEKYSNTIHENIVHTGQHYDDRMSDIFFRELEFPVMDINLNTGSDTHPRQISFMMEGVERVLNSLMPDMVLVYGDTNSTFAAAVAANKMNFPVMHVEAGVRSSNKTTPEEINRILTDHVSSVLAAPTVNGFNNLVKEGFNAYAEPPFSINNPILANTGDVMLDNLNYYFELAMEKSAEMGRYNVSPDNYAFMTLHRDFNTDSAERLNSIIGSMVALSASFAMPVIFSVHPRTAKAMREKLDKKLQDILKSGDHIITIPPATYLEAIMFMNHASVICTDSGGIQKEAFFLKKPVVLFREKTEWDELVRAGNTILAGAGEETLLEAAEVFLHKKPKIVYPALFGQGNAAELICQEILRFFEKQA
ncbi:MAG: UDP-N-acetylglucosamine 2-epimerase (non-hydrolyzing) [Bacteroidales bacterium]|nr:UDP-N-acetylglucosamine 2-epimerase (non-hydrolyzing) [Bacteroidales bacterium]